jgi:hypothetical protein
MKNTILICLLVFSFSTFAQTIRRCNNDFSIPLGLNTYRTLQEAHDAAAPNDIIYIEPSGTSYGSLTCAKTLKIYGNGYAHNENTGTYQNWDYRASIVDNISIEAEGAGTVLQGLTLDNNTPITIKAPNVIVTRCSFGGNIRLERNSVSQNASGTIISHNTFRGGSNLIYGIGIALYGYTTYNSTTCSYTAYQVENVTIKNNNRLSSISGGSNLFTGGTCSISPQTIPPAKNITIMNNNFIPINSSIGDCQNCTVHSNIFREVYSGSNIVGNSPGTAASYNVCGVNPCGYGTNNVNAANPNTLFISGTFTGIFYDKDFQLSNSSPAKGAGLGGVDAGAYGTNDPYRLSGLAPIPQITSYSKNTSSSIYTTSTPMTITISVKGNN